MERNELSEREYYEQVQAFKAITEKLNEEVRTLKRENLNHSPLDALPSEEATVVREINKIYLTEHKKEDSPVFDLLLKQECVDMFVQSPEKGKFRRFTWQNLPFPVYVTPPNFDQLLEYICADVGYNEYGIQNPFSRGFLVKNGHIVGVSIINLYVDAHADNKRVIFPASLGNLPRLQILDLRGNGFTQLPAEICNLMELRYLNLTLNRLVSLPEEFDRLKNLKALDLSANKSQVNLPESFGDLSVLEGLDLANNRITDLPSNFGSLHNLQKLDLMWNKLELLPPSFDQLTNLRFLQLDKNHFTSFPDIFSKFPNLEYLGIGGNPIRSLYGIPAKFYYRIYQDGAIRDFDFSPIGRNLLEMQNWGELEAFYHTPVQELAYKVVRGEKLSQHEEERLLHEATPDIRNLLESHLPRGHPYLVALQDRWHIQLSESHKIIL